MPVTKTATRALRAAERKQKANVVYVANSKKAVKAVRDALKSGKADLAQTALLAAFSSLDKAVRARVLPKNTAARLKSRLTLATNKALGKPAVLKSAKTETTIKKTKKSKK